MTFMIHSTLLSSGIKKTDKVDKKEHRRLSRVQRKFFRFALRGLG
jgi:hypothetical protein